MSTSASGPATRRVRPSGRLWPYSDAAAVLLVPLLLAVLLSLWAVLREPLDLQDAPAGRVLLGVTLLALLPVLLRVLDGMVAGGGSVEVGAVKVALTAAAAAEQLVVATPNVSPGVNIVDSGSAQIVTGLERARTSRVVIVDLEDGHAWWESRLLILCAGAARLGRPDVVVFTAARGGRERQFVGWSHAVDVRDRLLAVNPAYREAFGTAEGIALAARLSQPPGAPMSPTVRRKQLIVHPGATPALNPYLEEQLLADAIGHAEQVPQEIGVGRLDDLLEPVLHKGSVDRTDLDSEWFRKALRSDEEHVAMTDAGTYVGLLPRARLVSEVLLALTGR